jgi:hypothetical protein
LNVRKANLTAINSTKCQKDRCYVWLSKDVAVERCKIRRQQVRAFMHGVEMAGVVQGFGHFALAFD